MRSWDSGIPDASLKSLEDSSSLFRAEIYSTGYRMRFSLAHEISHVVLEREPPNFLQKASGRGRRIVIDELAGRILIPTALLRALIEGWEEPGLDIERIEDASRRVRASESVLLKRLGDLVFEQQVHLERGALVAKEELSEVRKESFAVRVWVCCLPREWYIPANTRLSSLGMRHLPGLFYSAKPFTINTVEDYITPRKRERWKKTSPILSRFKYKIYDYEQKRMMLAVFSLGPSR